MQWLRQRPIVSIIVLLLWGGFGDLKADPTAWPRFRGPDGSGVGQGGFPVHFGPQSNCVWKAEVPSGHGSPVIWGSSVFLVGFEDDQLWTLCLETETGRERWRRSLPHGVIERGARLSHPATSTPVTDGRRVWVYFGAFGLACYEADGTERWRRALPVPVLEHGSGTSPVLAGDLVIVNRDQDAGSHLLAVDADTGETVWKTERPEFHRGFSTPLPYPPGKPEEVVLAGSLALVSYGLDQGRERWRVRGLPNEMVSSCVAGAGLIFAAGWTHGSGVRRMPPFAGLLTRGDGNQDGQLTRTEAPPGPARQHFDYIDANKDGLVSAKEYTAIARAFDASQNVALAVRPGGQGDVTDTHVVWRHERGLPYVPTPLVHRGRFYMVKNGGLITCLDARTGKVLFGEERLGALGNYYASLVASGDLLAAASQQGVVVVLRVADTLQVLARNDLDEAILATPAIAGGRIWVRSEAGLYSFGK